MKILYVFREYKDRRKRYGYELRKLGHEVKFLDMKKHNKVTEKDIDGVDIVWLLKAMFIKDRVSPSLLKVIRKRSIPIVMYNCIATSLTIPDLKEVFDMYDYAFLTSQYFADKLETRYMPLGFYKEDYYPEDMERTVDMSFAGHPQTEVKEKNDMRVQYLKRLPEVQVHGLRLCKRLGIGLKIFNSHEYQRKLYCRTRVNLGLPFINSRHYNTILHLKNRFFEIPACKGLMLTAYSKEFTRLFEPEKEMFYYNNIDELREIAKELVVNSDKYEGVREAAYKRAIEEHQFSHRFKKIMEIIDAG